MGTMYTYIILRHFNNARLAERSKAPDLSSGSLWERGFEPHT